MKHYPPSTPHAAACRCCGLEVRPGRNAGSLSQLHHDRPLVGHADRHHQVHRLRKLRSRLPIGEPGARWLLPHLGGALPRRGLGDGVSQGGFTRRRQERISSGQGRRRQELLCPQAVQPLRRLPLHAGMSGGRNLRQSGWSRAGGPDSTVSAAVIACRHAPTGAASSIPRRTLPTNALSVITGSPRVSQPPAARPVRPALASLPT